jgi:hypothetical protein
MSFFGFVAGAMAAVGIGRGNRRERHRRERHRRRLDRRRYIPDIETGLALTDDDSDSDSGFEYDLEAGEFDDPLPEYDDIYPDELYPGAMAPTRLITEGEGEDEV